MKKLLAILFIFFLSISLSANIEATTNSFEKNIKIDLKDYLKTKKLPKYISKNLYYKYYRNHSYRTFWIDEDGVKEISLKLLKIIDNDAVLSPLKHKLFKLDSLKSLKEKIKLDNNLEDKLDFEILLTSTYHQYMRYLSRGLINWEKFEEILQKRDEEDEIIANWRKYDVRKNIRKLLYKSIENDDINIAISKANYTFPNANKMEELIRKYEKIALNGGYEKVPKVKKSLRPGNYYSQIKFLRKRLFQSKDLKNPTCIVQEKKNCLEYYDKELFKAVKNFQKNHGLVEDGIVGKNTISRLNVPIESKIDKLRVNLERMRWMPRTLGEKHLIVNIPDYNLKLFDENEIKLNMPVIVGKYEHPTPVFSHRLSEIVLNPYWRIPQRIVRREIIPKLVEDPNYLEKNDIKVFENWDHESMQYDVSSIDWSMYLDNDLIGTAKEAPMRFIQIPGNKNPLGKVKFLFPNRYSVYLHDTPFKHFFRNKRRAFSHGCIRLSQPKKLLETISELDEKIDYKESKEILKDIEKTDLELEKKIPVHIVYLTSWIDENEQVQFRDDIYKYDKIQLDILYKEPKAI